MINQGDLLLVPFPFSDQAGKKVRPVIVISNNNFNEHSEDLIVVGVTSNISKDRYALKLNNKDLEEGKIMNECCIKVENILRLDKFLVIKKIGKIKEEKTLQIIKIFESIIK
ncbi:MAG: type II toxin-antitoxin system PemK/MazF family toxin [Nanoarchaeota archaeon]|nr:type II toxin-antitoxin system PemK/MazF family toxin [Nanoarchaeota archaeon]